MSMQDPVADMLTRIRNAQSVGKISVVMPASKLKLSIAKVLPIRPREFHQISGSYTARSVAAPARTILPPHGTDVRTLLEKFLSGNRKQLIIAADNLKMCAAVVPGMAERYFTRHGVPSAAAKSAARSSVSALSPGRPIT